MMQVAEMWDVCHTSKGNEMSSATPEKTSYKIMSQQFTPKRPEFRQPATKQLIPVLPYGNYGADKYKNAIAIV